MQYNISNSIISRGSQLKNEKNYTFFYDETNNIRKFFLKDNKFNTEKDDNWVLGGIYYDTNNKKDFEELCKLVGPPSRVMRWCCTIFKTGTIQKRIKSLYRDKNQILTFYGIRRSESLSRSKYERESDSPKITKQRIVSPIIDWMDFDIWLYILTSGIR